MNEKFKRCIVNTVMIVLQLILFTFINSLGFRILGIRVSDIPYWEWVFGASLIFGSFMLIYHMKFNWYDSK